MNQEERIQKAREEAKRTKRNFLAKRISLWGGAVLILAAMVFGLAKLASAPQTGTPGELSAPVTAADHGHGNSIAKVTLVEYSDFECPACKQFYSALKEIYPKYQNQVLFVYRHFPLPQHPNSEIASRASEAAANQGKFWEMHDLLFENQEAWTGRENVEEIFIGYANELKLDINKFKADLNSKAVSDRIQRDVESGQKSNVDATPSFYLNGSKLTNLQTYGDLESAVSGAIGQ